MLNDSILRKTIEGLAETRITNLHHDAGKIFKPNDSTSKVLGYFKETGSYETVASDGDNTGLITVRGLLGVDHPQRTKVKSIWERVGIANTDNTVQEVVMTLIDNNVRALPLVEDREIIGITSQVDLLNELRKINELEQINVRDLMKSPVITVDPETGNDAARRLMLDNNISHLPVTKNGKLDGIVTAETMVHTFIAPASRMTTGNRSGQMVSGFSGKVSGLMDEQPLTVGADANALDVVKGMTRVNKSACLVVDEQDRVKGIITPRELLQPIYDLRSEEEIPVYIVGLSSEEDWFDSTVAENKVLRMVKRAQNMYPDLREIRVQIESQNPGGNRTRYEARAHIYLKKGGETIFVKQEGWDLLEVFDDLTQALDQRLRDIKGGPEKKSRRGRKKKPKIYFRP